MADEIVRQAVAQAKAGNREQARKLAAKALRADPESVAAWVVMAQVVQDRAQIKDCLENVLRLEPGHPWATLHLAKLSGAGASPAQPARAPEPAPVRSAAPPPPQPVPQEDDDPFSMADLRNRASSTADIAIDDLDSFFQPASAGSSRSDLDPLSGTTDWQRPLTDTSRDFRYDEIAPELDKIQAQAGKKGKAASQGQAKRKGPPLLVIFLVVFILFVVLTFAAAYLMRLGPFS